jgi:undecaprenyl-diphosphatase
VAGALPLAVAEALGAGGRRREDAGPSDGLALGVAQALALAPGVSRRGMTLAAARARGFARAEASALSWEVALPVVVAATVRKGAGLAAAPPSPATRRALAAGAGAALASTLASGPLLRAVERAPWWPYALWRTALGAAVVVRSRRLRAPA